MQNSFTRLSRVLLGPYESSLEQLLSNKLAASHVRVVDVSGGCGSSYHVTVSSKVFDGQSKLKQHRLVQQVLKDEISKWHAVKIDTSLELRCFVV